MNKFKSSSEEERSDGVVVSFHSKWADEILEKKISVFFRKRAPVTNTPGTVYLYVGTPVKRIVASAMIHSIEELTLEKCLEIRDMGRIGEKELIDYVGSGKVFAFRISNIKTLPETLTLDALSRIGGFTPPQSFFFLSKWGESQLIHSGLAK